VSNFEHRIAKIEDQLGTPGCVCNGRREGIALLSEFRGPATQGELERFNQRAFWTCPVHGPSRASMVLRFRPSGMARTLDQVDESVVDEVPRFLPSDMAPTLDEVGEFMVDEAPPSVQRRSIRIRLNQATAAVRAAHDLPENQS
jgi:hypothetical protein